MLNTYIIDTSVLADEEKFRFYYNKMPAERKKKIDRVKHRNDKELSLGAGILENEFAGEGFYHNLSHSGSRAVLAVSDGAVGIDIEPVREYSMKIVRRFFSEREQAYVSMNGAEGFFRIWTLKEAFMKATGEGISLGIDSFETVPEADDIKLIQYHDKNHWVYSEFCQDGYRAAVCALEKVEMLTPFVI